MNDKTDEPVMTAISINDSFSFSCNAEVPCFNECCMDLNQFLTPYDIIRLKNRLKMTSDKFLGKYTTQHTGPESGLPVISFKVDITDGMKCPLVKESGCSVYEDRPAACRTYPIARAISKSRETGQVTEHYALLKEPHCRGFETDHSQTVREWIDQQGIAIYNEMNDLMMEIISLKNILTPEPLDLKLRHFFRTAVYDMDTFRPKVFDNGILDKYNPDPDLFEKAKQDDTALLKLGLYWIKTSAFFTKQEKK